MSLSKQKGMQMLLQLATSQELCAVMWRMLTDNRPLENVFSETGFRQASQDGLVSSREAARSLYM